MLGPAPCLHSCCALSAVPTASSASPLFCLQALLEKLDTLLVVQGGAPPSSQPTSATAAAAAEAASISDLVRPPAQPDFKQMTVPSTAADEASSVPGEQEAATRALSQPDAEGAVATEAAEELAEVRLEQGDDGQVTFKLTLSPSKLASAAAASAAADAQAGGEEGSREVAQQQGAADPGHMPASPDAASSAARPPLSHRRVEPPPPRPGALYDGAARGAHWAGGWWGKESIEAGCNKSRCVGLPVLCQCCLLPRCAAIHSLQLPKQACAVLGCPAELLCFLRDTVDTRKPPLMEVALDCIQKMVSFKLLQGPVHHINHRWAAGSDSPGPVTP